MSRRSSGALLVLGLALAGPAHGQALLDVSGQVEATDPRLQVRVVVTNRGSRPTAGLDVSGEWRQQHAKARIAAGLAPGASGSVVLDFEVGLAPPGVHALVLLLEHPLEGALDAGGNPPMASERAWLLVALEESPAPDVRLQPSPSRMAVRGVLEVGLVSLDARPHRVSLQVLTARGLRVEAQPPEVDVPASGTARVRVPLMRAGATRGSKHGVLLVAESRDGLPVRTAVAVGQVEVAAEEGLVPRFRRWLFAAAVALLMLALGREVWRVRRRRAAA